LNLARGLAALLALLLALPLVGFTAHAQPKEIRIGFVTDRSGALSYYGDMSINGFILGLMYALNIPSFETVTPNLEWKLVWEDKVIHIIAASNVPAGQQVPDPVTATKVAEDLILNKGVEILVGTADSPSAIALTQIAEKYKVVFLVVPAADHEITKTYLNRYVPDLQHDLARRDRLPGARELLGQIHGGRLVRGDPAEWRNGGG